MGSRRQLVAIFTALSVAWTALWPLVSAAHQAGAAEAMPICHQAGTQVSPDMAPLRPTSPAPGAPQETKQHCPLCIMAFLAAFAPPVVAPSAPQQGTDAALGPYWAPLPFGIGVHIPQGRAPPFPLPLDS